jgi:hypothetical protein
MCNGEYYNKVLNTSSELAHCSEIVVLGKQNCWAWEPTHCSCFGHRIVDLGKKKWSLT